MRSSTGPPSVGTLTVVAQRRFPGREAQGVKDVAPVDLEVGVRPIVDLQQQVRALRALRLALARQPDHLARPDAGRHLHLQRPPVDTDALDATGEGDVQRNRDLRPHVTRRRRRAPAPTGAGAAGTEQRLEEIAEAGIAGAVLELEATIAEATEAGAGPATEARRRPEILAGPITLRAQLVVGRALFLVAQRLRRPR